MARRQTPRPTERRLPRRLYGFVDSVIPAEDDNPRSRLALHLDAVDADLFDADPLAIERDDALFLVRLLTTPDRLREFIGVDQAIPEEGSWVSLTTEKSPGSPRAWLIPSEGDVFGDPIPTNAVEVATGDALDPDAVARLRAACTSPNTTRTEASDLRAFIALVPNETSRIEAIDVGQAACVAFLDRDLCVGYFDVGAPIFFNRGSFPRHLAHTPSSEGVIILSHWDFDHYALAYDHPILRTLKWYAPDQSVGPRTAKFQKSLGSNLNFISGSLDLGSFNLKRCNGPASDRNNSGYAMRVAYDGQAVLLTGDAGYHAIPTDLQSNLTAVMIPHHGGKGATPPPGPCAKHSVAVASYGLPNKYRHPCEDQLDLHDKGGWEIQRTARHGKPPATPRGNRKLLPIP